MTYSSCTSHSGMSRSAWSPMVLSHGDHLHDGTFAIRSRFAHVINFTCGNAVVSLVDRAVGDGPVNIVMRDLAATRTSSLTIRGEKLSLDGRCFRLAPVRRWTSHLNLEVVRGPRVRQLAAEACEETAARAPTRSLAWLLRREAPEPGGFESACCREISEGVHLLFRGKEQEGVTRLCGTGIGLTPSGDDFIVGHLAARHLLEGLGIGRFTLPFDQFHRFAAHTTFLSRAALILAAEGSFAAPVKGFVEALGAGDGEAVRVCGTRLLGMGSTSGADVLTGMLSTLEEGLS